MDKIGSEIEEPDRLVEKDDSKLQNFQFKLGWLERISPFIYSFAIAIGVFFLFSVLVAQPEESLERYIKVTPLVGTIVSILIGATILITVCYVYLKKPEDANHSRWVIGAGAICLLISYVSSIVWDRDGLRIEGSIQSSPDNRAIQDNIDNRIEAIRQFFDQKLVEIDETVNKRFGELGNAIPPDIKANLGAGTELSSALAVFNDLTQEEHNRIGLVERLDKGILAPLTFEKLQWESLIDESIAKFEIGDSRFQQQLVERVLPLYKGLESLKFPEAVLTKLDRILSEYVASFDFDRNSDLNLLKVLFSSMKYIHGNSFPSNRHEYKLYHSYSVTFPSPVNTFGDIKYGDLIAFSPRTPVGVAVLRKGMPGFWGGMAEKVGEFEPFNSLLYVVSPETTKFNYTWLKVRVVYPGSSSIDSNKEYYVAYHRSRFITSSEL